MQRLFADLMDHALAYSGDDATRAACARQRAAVVQAYRHMATQHKWAYYWTLGRVITNAATGTTTDDSTIAYTASSRTVTLTGATWPSWAEDGYLIISNVPYQVEDVLTTTTLTLTAATAPTSNIAAGTSYTLQRDQYPLPADFVGGDEVVVNEVGAVLTYMHPRNWASERRTMTGPGQPWMFSYIGDPDRNGQMKMVLWPPPDNAYNVDFLYWRRARDIIYDQVTDGLASVTAAGTTVTGSGTNFKSAHVGSYIRFGADNVDAPTGQAGMTPAVFEAKITAVASATSLTIDTAAGETLTGVRYVISDPVDCDWTVMGDYLLREVERQFRLVSRMRGTAAAMDEEGRAYQLALTRALEADARSTSRDAALRKQTRRSGFIHYPIQFSGG